MELGLISRFDVTDLVAFVVSVFGYLYFRFYLTRFEIRLRAPQIPFVVFLVSIGLLFWARPSPGVAYSVISFYYSLRFRSGRLFFFFVLLAFVVISFRQRAGLPAIASGAGLAVAIAFVIDLTANHFLKRKAPRFKLPVRLR